MHCVHLQGVGAKKGSRAKTGPLEAHAPCQGVRWTVAVSNGPLVGTVLACGVSHSRGFPRSGCCECGGGGGRLVLGQAVRLLLLIKVRVLFDASRGTPSQGACRVHSGFVLERDMDRRCVEWPLVGTTGV